MFPDKQCAGVGDAFIEVRALGFVQQGRLGLFEPVECIGCLRIGGFVRVDQEGFLAVG